MPSQNSIMTMREIVSVATPTIDLVLTLLRLRADSLIRAENASSNR